MLQGLLKVYVLTRMQVHGLNGMGPVAASAADLKFEVLRRIRMLSSRTIIVDGWVVLSFTLGN